MLQLVPIVGVHSIAYNSWWNLGHLQLDTRCIFCPDKIILLLKLLQKVFGKICYIFLAFGLLQFVQIFWNLKQNLPVCFCVINVLGNSSILTFKFCFEYLLLFSTGRRSLSMSYHWEIFSNFVAFSEYLNFNVLMQFHYRKLKAVKFGIFEKYVHKILRKKISSSKRAIFQIFW